MLNAISILHFSHPCLPFQEPDLSAHQSNGSCVGCCKITSSCLRNRQRLLDQFPENAFSLCDFQDLELLVLLLDICSAQHRRQEADKGSLGNWAPGLSFLSVSSANKIRNKQRFVLKIDRYHQSLGSKVAATGAIVHQGWLSCQSSKKNLKQRKTNFKKKN